MDDKIVKTIYSLDKKNRVNFIQKSNGTFSFEEEYFSEYPLELCWIPHFSQFNTICDSFDSTLREARGRINWLDEQWDQIEH